MNRLFTAPSTFSYSSSGGGMDDSLALSQAGWAVRRLTAGQGPGNGGWAGGVTAFLGHAHGEPLSASPAVEDLAEVMIAAQYLHPVTQAAVLFHAWRFAGQGPARDMEAAVMAACHGASIGRANIGQAGATFLPLTLAGVGALRTSGSAHARLIPTLADQNPFVHSLIPMEVIRDF